MSINRARARGGSCTIEVCNCRAIRPEGTSGRLSFSTHAQRSRLPRNDHRQHATVDQPVVFGDLSEGEIRANGVAVAEAVQDRLTEPGRPQAPIDLAEIVLDRHWRLRVVMTIGDARPVSGELPDLGRRRIVGRGEDGDDALLDTPFSLAVAATGRLDDLVEPGLGPPDARKVEIHPGLDQAGGDDPAGLLPLQSLADPIEDPAAMGGILPGGEMDDTVEPAREGCTVKGKRMPAAVDDDQRSRRLAQHLDQRVVIERPGPGQRGAPQATARARPDPAPVRGRQA